MSHKTKDCLYRPRKTGAKWTGRDIQADEVVESVSLGWDAKRDRWNGYDSREYTQVVKDYNELEAMKKIASGTEEDQKDGDHYAEETDMGRSQPTSTRQLRLREDTAKYLVDLNLESAKYDPKTRSMDTSAAQTLKNGEVDVSDGFVRPSEAEAFERAQKYAWETQESSSTAPNTNANINSSATNSQHAQQKLHLQANPTEGALLIKKKETADAEAKAARQKYLSDKYGDNVASNQLSTLPPKPSIITSERYIEYDASGKVKGEITTTPRSKYPEDILQNNHTSVWGSWWRDFTWGYACCHSTTKNSYCTGEEGKTAFEEAEGLRKGQMLLEGMGAYGEEKERLEVEQNGEDVAERKESAEADTSQARKRTIGEITSGVTEEDMESYKRNKMSAADPMASMLGKDELLENT